VLNDFWENKVPGIAKHTREDFGHLKEGHQKKIKDNLLNHLPLEISESDIVIDWGIGSGMIAELLLPCNLYGVDVARDSLDNARAAIGDYHEVYLRDLSDAEHLCDFDVKLLVSVATIQHFPGREYWENILELWQRINPEYIAIQTRYGDSEAEDYYADYYNGLSIGWFSIPGYKPVLRKKNKGNDYAYHIFSRKKKAKTIIVGNSPELLGRNMGDIIDSYPCIIRLNDYQIGGYEKDVGTRECIWGSGMCPDSRVRYRPNMWDIWVFYPNIIKAGYGVSLSRIRGLIDAALVKKFHLVPAEIIEKLNHYTGLHYAGTGLLTIAYCIFVLKIEVDIIGFDSFQKHKGHYYSPEPAKVVAPHEFNKESDVIKQLEDDGYIKSI